MDRVIKEYGLEFPYVPRVVMQEIEENREQCYDEAVWDRLAIPKPLREWDSFLVTEDAGGFGIMAGTFMPIGWSSAVNGKMMLYTLLLPWMIEGEL